MIYNNFLSEVVTIKLIHSIASLLISRTTLVLVGYFIIKPDVS